MSSRPTRPGHSGWRGRVSSPPPSRATRPAVERRRSWRPWPVGEPRFASVLQGFARALASHPYLVSALTWSTTRTAHNCCNQHLHSTHSTPGPRALEDMKNAHGPWLPALKLNGHNDGHSPGPPRRRPHQRRPFTLVFQHAVPGPMGGAGWLATGANPALSLRGREGFRTNCSVLADFHVAV